MSVLVPTPHTIRAKRGKPLPKFVENDVYKISERIKEIDPNLFIMLFEDTPRPWVVYEDTPSGPQVVQRYTELTPAILDNLRMMAAVPFTERVKKLSDEIDRENEELGKMDPERFERFAYDFRKAMIKANMVDGVDHTSTRFLPNKRRQVS